MYNMVLIINLFELSLFYHKVRNRYNFIFAQIDWIDLGPGKVPASRKKKWIVEKIKFLNTFKGSRRILRQILC